MYHLETGLQPINNLQRNHQRYFYSLTNAQYTPFLSQGTHRFSRTLCNILLFIAEMKVLQGYKEGVVQTWRFLTHSHMTSPGEVFGSHYSRGRSIFSTVSDPCQEMCTLGSSRLCKRSEESGCAGNFLQL